MQNEANMEATASSTPTTRYIVRVRIDEKQKAPRNRAMIHNHSERDIILIPILHKDGQDPQMSGFLYNGKDIKISAENSKEVKLSDYARSTSSSDLCTSILFRVADKDNVRAILEDFRRNGKEETLHLPDYLERRVLHLQCKVNIVKADQINSMRDLIMDIKAKQEKLKEVVEDLIMDQTDKQKKLKDDVEDLLKKTDDLNVALTGVEHSCTH